MNRSQILPVTLMLGFLLAGPVAHASPPVPLDLAGSSLTISAPETYQGGTPFSVSGQLLAYGHLPFLDLFAEPVPNQQIDIFVGNALAKTVTTNSNGAYNTQLTFDALPPTVRSLHAVAFRGNPLETSSPTIQTRLARILIGLRVDPSSVVLGAGGTFQFKAYGEFDDGRPETDVTTIATWSTSDTEVATVGNTAGDKGSATAITPGSATITAALDGLSATASVQVA